jgi:hypothetical protein
MATKIERMKKADPKPEEGTMYLSSTGVWFKAPKLDYDKILKYEENIYLAGALEKQQRLVFREKYTIGVTSPDGVEADESDKRVCADLAKTLTKMTEQKDVRLWIATQKMWKDPMLWGPWLANIPWDYEKVPVMMGGKWNAATNAIWWMKKIRRLPPESFISTGLASSKIRNRLLPGICLNDTTGEIEFYQRQDSGQIKKLQNVTMVTDPISNELGGKPIVTPVYYVLPMLDFTWQGLMQQNNMLGAGGKFFIKVTNPVGDDKAVAQEIVNKINRSQGYQLRGNMEVVAVPITANSTALDTINALDKLVRNHFSPASSLSQGDATSTIGGSSGSELELYRDYLKATRQNLAGEINQLLQPFLDVNEYEGYTSNVTFPEPQIDYSDILLKAVDMGYRTQTIGLNDRRALMATVVQKGNVELKPLDDAGIAALTAEFEALAPAGGSVATRLAKAQLAISAAGADRLNPTAFLSQKHIRNTVQAALNIEDGEE